MIDCPLLATRKRREEKRREEKRREEEELFLVVRFCPEAVVDTLFSDTFREVSMAWSSVALHLKTLGMSKDYVRVFYPPPPLLLLLSSSSFSLLPFHHYLHDNRSRR